MYTEKQIINQLSEHLEVFRSLLTRVPEHKVKWKEKPEKWCLLEIICHLYDEEREDFRARVDAVLHDRKLQPFDPLVWVRERRYIEQDFQQKLHDFLLERERSVEWLQSLQNPQWGKTYDHPKLGALSAGFFLTNWLAHDYLHIRQIMRVNYAYLNMQNGIDLNYAGNW